MKAVILAAGRGSRLHPYTADCPKCLTELGGQSLIARQLSVLRGAGIDDITIVTGYQAEMLALPGTQQCHNEAWATTNMVESLFCAEASFGDDLIVSYSDIVYQPDVIEALLASTADVSVIVDRQWRAYWAYRFDDPLSDAESLRMTEGGLITDIGGPVDDIDEIEAQYIGLMRFQGAGVEALRRTRAALGDVHRAWMDKRPLEKAYMTDLLMEMILTGVDVSAVPIRSGWLEIDTVEDYENAAAGFEDGSIRKFYLPQEMSSPA